MTPDPIAAPTALVTGASSGIGAGFCRRLAADGYRLVVVARDAARLDALAVDLVALGSPCVEVLVADLTDLAGQARVRERLIDEHRPVDVLVNNAGMGLGRDFDEVSDDDLRRQLELNVAAVLLLTHAALPLMVQRRNGAVINVASVAGLVPNPGASYAGTKSWVVAFSEGLSMTLRGTGVRVQALCPGLVRTEFHQRADIDLRGAPAFSWLDVDSVVAASLADLARDRVLSVPGTLYKAIVTVTARLPRRLVRFLSARSYQRRTR